MLRYPLVIERCRPANDAEVGVVVHEGQLMLTGEYCGEQIGDPDRAVTAAPGEAALSLEGGLPVLVLSRQVLVGISPVSPNLLVLGRAACAVERFCVQGGTCRYHAGLDQR